MLWYVYLVLFRKNLCLHFNRWYHLGLNYSKEFLEKIDDDEFPGEIEEGAKELKTPRIPLSQVGHLRSSVAAVLATGMSDGAALGANRPNSLCDWN